LGRSARCPASAARLARFAESNGFGAKTAREQDYIHAISEFYADWDHVDLKIRAHKYRSAVEQLHAKYPGDPEAGIFYALALIATESSRDPSFADRRKAGEIPEAVFAKNPDHPGVAHYLIHAYDKPLLASRGLSVRTPKRPSRQIGDIAPIEREF